MWSLSVKWANACLLDRVLVRTQASVEKLSRLGCKMSLENLCVDSFDDIFENI